MPPIGLNTAASTDPEAGLHQMAAELRLLVDSADLVVASGYGHSRPREWVLGGVTRDFLLQVDRCSLVSH